MKTKTFRQQFIDWVNGEHNAPYEQTEGQLRCMDTLPAAEPCPCEKKPKQPLKYIRMEAVAYRVAAVLVCVSLMAALVYTVLCLPAYNDPSAPTNNEVSQRYVEKGTEETGAVNTVAGMILDYRAFDTFGESTVLFAATAAVLFLTFGKHSREQTAHGPFADPNPDPILQLGGRLLLPFIMVYGIYVVLNGHLSPGGGFSGGAVLGGGLILASSLFGQKKMYDVISPQRASYLSVACLLAYASMKGYSFFTGANHVGWEIPKGTPGDIISAGFILPLNICVGIIVACTMFSFYSLFSQGEEE